MFRLPTLLGVLLLPGLWAATQASAAEDSAMKTEPMYIYTVGGEKGPVSYDDAMAAACLEGLINRDTPIAYLGSTWSKFPAYWLDIFTKDGHWLEGRPQKQLATLDELRDLAGDRVKGAVIWDPAVPATVNVATTIAGVEDGVVLSPELADAVLAKWKLPVLKDLRGMFDGSETGSAKNDAYRWAIREYLDSGKCNPHFLHLFADSWETRQKNDTGYVVTRDWSVYQRAFVFDLSPWADVAPLDDLNQKLGTDKATYEMILAQTMKNADGKVMTELAGFFDFKKYSTVGGPERVHEPVATEWETVYLISPYNGYQNTIASACYNQSFHTHFSMKPLKQGRPEPTKKLEKKTYLCILMADYDSMTPLYEFMPKSWDDPARGELPVVWGINPNLSEAYPDIFTYLYETAKPNDHFAADASAAGYMNPNRVPAESIPLFIRHNQHFYDLCDMTMSPMVLDWSQPTAQTKDAFTHFSMDGYASILIDFHHPSDDVLRVKSEIWKGMPITELINSVCNFPGPEAGADIMNKEIADHGDGAPGFYFFRIVWTKPSDVIAAIDKLKEKYPNRDYEVLDPYTFFRLFKENEEATGK